MNLHIFYRACDADKPEVRPLYFTKVLAFKSLLAARDLVKKSTLKLFYDGKAPGDFADLVAKAKGSTKNLNYLGNSGSCWYAYQEALKLNANDWVYFVEDDYLHQPDAIIKLLHCIEDVPEADYITLFDHPVRYVGDYHFGLDLPHKNNTIFISRDHHWRTQESTCMTFAAKVSTLIADQDIFHKYVKSVRIPEDRELFKRLQGLPGYEKGSPHRLLIGPMPSLATHCHIPWMAPIVDWESVASRIS